MFTEVVAASIPLRAKHPNEQPKITKFGRLYLRALGKLKTAMVLDHSDTTEQYKKNKRAEELHRLVATAVRENCLSTLCVADLHIDIFLATGR